MYFGNTPKLPVVTELPVAGLAGRLLVFNSTVFFDNGASWIKATGELGAIGVRIESTTDFITSGYKASIVVPYNAIITGATLLATSTGSVVVDIVKDVFESFNPNVATSITGSVKPTLDNEDRMTNNILTGWTTTISSQDVLGFKIESITNITELNITLEVIKI